MTLPTASLLANTGGMQQKAFAGTDKKLPVIGMGTWRTFNVGNDPALLDACTEVVKAFFEHSGGLIIMPLIAPLSGGSWYQTEVFDIHADPTAVTTLGLVLIMLRGVALWIATIIPALWLVIPGLTLEVLDSLSTAVLFAVLAIALVGLVWKSIKSKP